MSDTPRTDEAFRTGSTYTMTQLARTLERENAELAEALRDLVGACTTGDKSADGLRDIGVRVPMKGIVDNARAVLAKRGKVSP